MLYGTMPFTGHDFRTLRRQITSGLIHQPPILSGLLSEFVYNRTVISCPADKPTF